MIFQEGPLLYSEFTTKMFVRISHFPHAQCIMFSRFDNSALCKLYVKQELMNGKA